MKNAPLQICDVTIHPGESANLALPLPEIYSCSPLHMPIKVIHGKERGPCLLVFSVIRGNELNGLEIVNRLLQTLKEQEVKGTVIGIPVLNVYGLTHFPATLPSGKFLENCFPGNEEGSFGERIAHLFVSEILKKADYCIELQTGGLNHNILPQVYCNFDNKEAKKLAKSFQTPVVTDVEIGSNSLRQTTEDLQIPFLVYQGGEAMRFDDNTINLGMEGVVNVMKSLDMLSKAPNRDITPIFSKDEEWIVSHKGGILHPKVILGQTIKKGELVGVLMDPFGVDFDEHIQAPQDGVVVGINTTPLIYEGLPIFKISSFLDDEKAESTIEEWDRNQPDSYINT